MIDVKVEVVQIFDNKEKEIAITVSWTEESGFVWKATEWITKDMLEMVLNSEVDCTKCKYAKEK